MANNVDKSVYQAPLGIDKEAQDEEGIELEVEAEDEGEGDLEVNLTDEDMKEVDDDFNANLADEIDDSSLQSLASDLLGDYDSDVSSRRDWLETYADGLDLLGLKIEDRTEPWPGACSVYHPLLTEAVVKFQAETMSATFPAQGPVKTQIIGKVDKDKEAAAKRVQEDMNYRMTDQMVEYRPEHERMLWGLGLSGNAFKKVYYDPALERQVAIYVPAEDIVVPYGASNLDTAERVTHVMRKTKNELRKLQVAGFYRDVELGDPVNVLENVEKKIAERLGFDATTDERYRLLEMHVDLDLSGYEDQDEDGDATGIALPYVVTIEKGTSTILSIRRNWDPEDPLKMKRQHFVHYGYVPGFGFYCFGLVHLVGAFAKSGTMLTRQLVDAGTLANLPGGFKTRGLRVKGDDTPIAPAEFRDVDVPSGSIRDNIMPLPYKEPSQVLMALLQNIVEEGRKFAGAADIQISDMSANSPVGTTLAILERSLKVISAVQARIHYAMKQEFKLLKSIIRDYTPEEYSYEPESGEPSVKQSDYDQVDVIPVSDPNASTMAQKVVQYQAVMQMAQQSPDMYDMKELNRQMLEALGVKNVDLLIKPDDEEQKPKDPVSENMDMLNGKPAKAFIYQDHEAHITAHMSLVQDPKIQGMMGQAQNAQAIAAAFQAHVSEHIAFAYRRQIEEQLGVPLPNPDEELPEDIEVDLSRLVASAAQKLLQKDTAEQQQQQQQQQAQDPILMIQQKELEIKEREQGMKEQKEMFNAQMEQQKMQLEAEKLSIERERIASQERTAGARLEAESAKTQMTDTSKKEMEGARLGVDIAKHKAEMSQREKQQSGQRETDGTRIGIEIAKHKAELAQRDKQRSDQKDKADKQNNISINQLMKQSKPDTPKEE
jgi:hypothetical protein